MTIQLITHGDALRHTAKRVVVAVSLTGALTLAMTLMRFGTDPDASVRAGFVTVSVIGIGIIVSALLTAGLSYRSALVMQAAVDGAWIWLFERSDPLNREIEGSGVSALSALVRGAAASVIGGLLFSIVMLMTGTLPRVARIVGGTSPGVGFAVHLIIAALIGATYGVLFHHEATTTALPSRGARSTD
jgi:hypothetical protein